MTGYDVMVRVGRSRFLEHRQREEIRNELKEQHGVRLSSGEVSYLARLFLEYLARLHRVRAPLLKAALESDGGWPMHVDATGEAGRGTLLVVVAGWRQWVLGAWKISTERAELILPCLRQTVQLFGVPCAAMRDLGKAMTPAIDNLLSELGVTIPVLACHQHFLADVGSDLLEPSHTELRDLFRRTKVCPKLRALIRDLGHEFGSAIEEAREAVRRWQSMVDAAHKIETGRDGLAIIRAIAQWTLDFKADACGLDFPFDRPYLDLYNRCMKSLRAADAFLLNVPKGRKVTTTLKRLHRILKPVACEVPFRSITNRLHQRVVLFDKLRRVLRVTAELPLQETAEDELKEMQTQLEDLVTWFREHRPERGPAQDIRKAIDLILQHLDRHGANLWGHAIDLPESARGGVRLVPRTNFLAENLFKGLKHEERRRSGRKNLGQDLEHLPAEAAVAYNLQHDDYVSIVCGSLDHLPEVFAQLDQEDRARKLNGTLPDDQLEDLGVVLQVASASLSKADRRVIRTVEMDRRVTAAANSRAPRYRF